MPSTYSNLKIELIGTGEQTGTWGQTTNNNLGYAIEEALVGSADVVFSNTDVQLSLINTNLPQTARNLRLNLTGAASTPLNLIVPSIEKFYIINNTLSNNITVKTLTGTGITVAAGLSTLVYNDSINVYDAVNYIDLLTLGTPLAVTSGGTGVSTSTGSGSVVLNTSPALVTPDIGTPTAGTLTNCTGLPLTSAAGVTGTLPVFNGGTGVTTSTGSGSVVLSNSPALTTPNLGTPSAGTLTNCSGLPVGGIQGLGTNVGTFLATPTSANLAAAVTTTSTGSGSLVFGSTPTISNPNITGTVTGNASYSTVTLTTPNIDTAPVPTVSGTAPIYLPRAWVNFNPTVAGTFPGGASTVTRVATSTTATITCATAHNLQVGHYVYATSGVVADLYQVQTVTTTGTFAGRRFTITTVATTALNAVAITFSLATIRGSGNINSVYLTPQTSGYVINFQTALPSVNYMAIGSTGAYAASTASQDNTLGVGTWNNSGTAPIYTTLALACQVTTNGTFEANADLVNVMVIA